MGVGVGSVEGAVSLEVLREQLDELEAEISLERKKLAGELRRLVQRVEKLEGKRVHRKGGE